MLVKVRSIALKGIETLGVDVEVNILSRGLPHFDIVGLPDKSVDESRHRVKAAFQNSGIEFPNKKIIVNLAPADINKEGSFYDLPIAVGIMCASYNGVVPKNSVFFGELSLDGSVRHTKGSFLLSVYAKENNFRNVYIPISCAKEASYIDGINIFGIKNLNQLFDSFIGGGRINVFKNKAEEEEVVQDCKLGIDFSDVLGQNQVKRALEICAAGGHNMIMVGPPGSGKSMLAKALVSILPPLTSEEAIEVTKIYSSVGKIPPNGALIRKRPFRFPHHTISYAGMIGGGSIPKPGEITLSHRGVLFMDEFSEFGRPVLEALRQPMEDGVVTVSRSRGSITFPAKFVLIGSSNPCPCGFFGHPTKRCICGPKRIQNYQRKMSGPILDRIDLHINVLPVERSKLNISNLNKKSGETSSEVRKRVLKVRNLQYKRFVGEYIYTNAEMGNNQIAKFCKLDPETDLILNQAVSRFGLSARAYFKIIKVAKTIADLDGKDDISIQHMAESIQYRSKNF